MLTVRVKRLRPEARMPTRAHDTDAGWDLFAAPYAPFVVRDRVTLPTGLALEIPPGWYGQIVGRSGLGSRFGVTIHGGCIDASFRGEVMVILSTQYEFTIRPGDRVAQLVILPVPDVEMVEADELSPSPRGEGGFGSSGR